MWTAQQRYSTGCAVAVLLGFVFLAFYVDPTGLARLNPFSGEECATDEQQHTLSKQHQSHERLPGGEGRESGTERDTRNPSAAAPDQQSSQGDYYACRLAVYTRQLALFTGALVVVTVILTVTGIYQGVHLGRAANAAKASADALPAMERAYLFLMPEAIEFKTRELRRHGRGDAPRVPEPGFEEMEEEIDREIIVRFHFTNYGRTPAIITAIHYDLKYFPPADRDPLGSINEWPTIPPGRLEETLAIHPITSNGHSGDFDWVFSIRHEQWEDAQRGLGHIIFWGLVVYADVLIINGKLRSGTGIRGLTNAS